MRRYVVRARRTCASVLDVGRKFESRPSYVEIQPHTAFALFFFFFNFLPSRTVCSYCTFVLNWEYRVHTFSFVRCLCACGYFPERPGNPCLCVWVTSALMNIIHVSVEILLLCCCVVAVHTPKCIYCSFDVKRCSCMSVRSGSPLLLCFPLLDIAVCVYLVSKNGV